MKKIMVALLIALGILLTDVSKATASYPNYDGYVTDQADVLSDEQEQALETKLKTYDEETSTQLAVLTIKTLDGESIEKYSIELAEQWAPGTEKNDNGIILLVVTDDRELRIEVGYGLEGDVTDIEAKHIIDGVIVPEFKNGDYYLGIDKGLSAIIESIDSEFEVPENNKVNEDGITLAVIIIIAIIIIVFVALVSESDGFGGGYGGGGGYYSSGLGRSTGGGFSSGSKTTFGGGGFGGGGASGKW